jgi:hypothetical protein
VLLRTQDGFSSQPDEDISKGVVSKGISLEKLEERSDDVGNSRNKARAREVVPLAVEIQECRRSGCDGYIVTAAMASWGDV